MVPGPVKKPVTLSAEEARLLLNRWADGGFFRPKRLGDRVEIAELHVHESFTVRLSTQYEDRTAGQASVPYRGEPLDNREEPPRPWEVPVSPPADFEDRTVIVPVPHTERVETCSPCLGSGCLTCGQCQGLGRSACMMCGGVGSRMVTDTVTRANPDGTQSVHTETKSHSCTTCGGTAKVFCMTCHGSGRLVCGTCQGQCRLKTYDQVSVHFQPASLTTVLDATDLSDDQLKVTNGDIIVDERAARLTTVATVNPAVDDSVAQLLKTSHVIAERGSHILFQRVHIERIAIHEVLYRHRNSTDRRFWVYGTDQRVFAPRAPIAWGRWLALIGLIAGPASAIGLAVVHKW